MILGDTIWNTKLAWKFWKPLPAFLFIITEKCVKIKLWSKIIKKVLPNCVVNCNTYCDLLSLVSD